MKNLLSTILILFVSLNLHANVNCPAVETLGNASMEYIRLELNEKIAQKVIRTGARSHILIEEVKNLEFKGCRLDVLVDLSLRKYLSIKKGKAHIRSTVTHLDGRKICLMSAKVHRLHFADVTRFTERILKFLSTLVMPPHTCFDL